MGIVNSTLRIAVATNSISRNAGGLFWSVRALSKNAIDAGCEIHVFGGEDAHSDDDQPVWAGVPLTVLPTIGPDSFGYQPALTQALDSYQPDLLHVHGLWTYPSLAASQWSHGHRPYMISPRGMLDSWALNNSGWKKKIAGWAYENAHLRGAACIHALCEAELVAIRAYGLKNPVAVIPNGVDLPNTDARYPLPEWDKRLPEGANVLLFLSRIHPKKGLVRLLDAWASARSDVPSADTWQLVIAGWDQDGHETELQQRAHMLGIESSVHFVGSQFGQDKVACMRRANAFILPSFSEGLPMAVLEAWSYALPVVITPQCNLPEGFKFGAAIHVEPEVASLVEGLTKLFCMPVDARVSMGQLGHELVKNRFDWKIIGRNMAATYRWMYSGGTAPTWVDFI